MAGYLVLRRRRPKIENDRHNLVVAVFQAFARPLFKPIACCNFLRHPQTRTEFRKTSRYYSSRSAIIAGPRNRGHFFARLGSGFPHRPIGVAILWDLRRMIRKMTRERRRQR
jgi:hypothetical protein